MQGWSFYLEQEENGVATYWIREDLGRNGFGELANATDALSPIDLLQSLPAAWQTVHPHPSASLPWGPPVAGGLVQSS